jgi:hypothetical protein
VTQVAVLVPVLNRPERVEPLIDSLYGSQERARLHLVFIASPEDEPEIDALETSGEDFIVMAQERAPGDYARKMNAAIDLTDETWVFLGADDLCFCSGWADEAIRVGLDTGKQVIGTNDLGNPHVKSGMHSTHTLVHRDYTTLGTADDPTRLLHEGYAHNWVDAEFIETARSRDQFVMARDAWVEHLHPHWRKGPMDDTYQLGLRDFENDRRLFRRRRRLWTYPPKMGGFHKLERRLQ